MPSIVLGIFTLSCLPLAVLGEPGMMYRVDVTIPTKEGRNETEVDASIDDILNWVKPYGISDHFAVKILDSQRYILVLEIQDMCNWHRLTTPLSNLGYKLSVTSVERCQDYATRYDVNVTYAPREEVEKHLSVFTAELLIDEKGVKGEEYLGMVKKHFEDDAVLTSDEYGGSRCYANTMDIPLRAYECRSAKVTLETGHYRNKLLYIGFSPPENTARVNFMETREGTTRMEINVGLQFGVLQKNCTRK